MSQPHGDSLRIKTVILRTIQITSQAFGTLKKIIAGVMFGREKISGLFELFTVLQRLQTCILFEIPGNVFEVPEVEFISHLLHRKIRMLEEELNTLNARLFYFFQY